MNNELYICYTPVTSLLHASNSIVLCLFRRVYCIELFDNHNNKFGIANVLGHWPAKDYRLPDGSLTYLEPYSFIISDVRLLRKTAADGSPLELTDFEMYHCMNPRVAPKNVQEIQQAIKVSTIMFQLYYVSCYMVVTVCFRYVYVFRLIHTVFSLWMQAGSVWID